MTSTRISHFYLVALIFVLSASKLHRATGQIAFPTLTSIPSTQAYFTQQTYPWGYSYSFSEIGKSHNAASAKTAATVMGDHKNNLINPLQLGILFAPRLALVPLPILRQSNESSTTVPSTNPIPKDESSTSTTTSTTTEATLEPTGSTEKISVATDDKSKQTPNTGFYFSHLSSPLSFTYGFTTFGNNPNDLPIPHLPLLGIHYNSSDPLLSINNKETPVPVEDNITEKVDATTKADTENDLEKSDDTAVSTEKISETEKKLDSFSEPTTQSSNKNKEEEDPNLETETISPIKSQSTDPLGKLKEESLTSKNEESTTIGSTVPPISSTIADDSKIDIVSTSTSKSDIDILLINKGDKSEFSYSIKDETTFDEKSHQEQRDGDSVKGKYSVVEPDGALRTVTYVADEDGFKAEVVRKESYAKPFPVLQNRVTRAPGAIQSLSNPNVLSYHYNGFHFPPPKPGVVRNFGYGYYIVP